MSTYKDYLFKLRWRATALVVKVPGKSPADAQKRVESLLRRMEGGAFCEDIIFLGEVD